MRSRASFALSGVLTLPNWGDLAMGIFLLLRFERRISKRCSYGGGRWWLGSGAGAGTGKERGSAVKGVSSNTLFDDRLSPRIMRGDCPESMSLGGRSGGVRRGRSLADDPSRLDPPLTRRRFWVTVGGTPEVRSSLVVPRGVCSTSGE